LDVSRVENDFNWSKDWLESFFSFHFQQSAQVEVAENQAGPLRDFICKRHLRHDKILKRIKGFTFLVSCKSLENQNRGEVRA